MCAGCRRGNASSARRSPSSQLVRHGRRRRERDRDSRRRRARNLLLPLPEQGTRAARAGMPRRSPDGGRLRPLPRRHARSGGRTDTRSSASSTGLEQRLGSQLFKELLALHFSPTRPPSDEWTDHPVIVLLVREIERARGDGEVHPEVDAFYSADVLPARRLRRAHHDGQRRQPGHDADQVGRHRRPRSGDPMTPRRTTSINKEV